MTKFVVSSASDAIGVVGVITVSANGEHRFLTKTSARGNSRRSYSTPHAAVPRWLSAGYLVDADSADAAVTLVRDYRNGSHYTLAHAAAGHIEVVRRGRVVG